MKNYLAFIGMFVLIAGFTTTSFAGKGLVRTEKGLRYRDLAVGTGATAKVGKIVVVHIRGWLEDNGKKGKEFLNSYDRGKPVSFKLGTNRVMQGWNEGIVGMKVGGKRRLMVPPELGYGAKGVGDIVPPKADLIFDVELLKVKE